MHSIDTISTILRTDGYKPSHWSMLPDETTFVYSYLESRGGKFQSTVQFGVRPVLEYLTEQITKLDVAYAEARFTKYYGDERIFNRAGWLHIVNDHDGYLPLRIKSAPEGMVIPTHNVLSTLENTCPKCAWVTNYVESIYLKVWYPITVATLSREIKKIILGFLEKNGTPALLPWKLHDFGYRGVSSEESSIIGGMAHLVNFRGTDTILALEGATFYYGADMAGDTIPATEHADMAALGEEGEFRQMDRFLDVFKDYKGPAIACVSDTYNIFNAVTDGWGGELKAKVEALNGKVLVVRPDSGEPAVIVRQVAELLEKAFGSTVNDKGYKVLNHVRIIQGDGVNLESIREILDALDERRFSADNVAFGMGGALLQGVNRDTQKFAIKASSMVIGGRIHDVQKRPITDNTKRSKAGRLKLIRTEDGVLSTVPTTEIGHDLLETVYENGKILIYPKWDEIVERAEIVTQSQDSWATT